MRTPALLVSTALLSAACGDNLDAGGRFLPDSDLQDRGRLEDVAAGEEPELLPLAFPSGDQMVFVGDSFASPAVAVDPDVEPTRIWYTSSDPAIATVDDDGTVTANASGYVTITASSFDPELVEPGAMARVFATSGAAPRSFLTEEETAPLVASYDMLVSFVASAWVGESDTLVTFSEGATGVKMYRSTDPDCDIASIESCADGQSDVLSVGPTFTDTTLTLDRPGYYTYVTGGAEHYLPMSRTPPPARWHHSAVVFNNQIMVVGGHHDYDLDDPAATPVLASSDGINWLELAQTPFSRRYAQAAAVLGDTLYVIAGRRDGGTWLGDVWMTNDGATWTEMTPAPPFVARYGHDAIAWNNRLWVVGGWDGAAGLNDVWSWGPEDGWVEETPAAAFAPQSHHSLFVHQGDLWLLSKRGDKVWRTANGKDWTLVAADTGMPSRLHPGVTTFEGKIWVVAGYDEGDHDDVYFSEDGVTWTQALEHGPFPAHTYSELVVFDNRLWIIGGANEDLSYMAEAWSSLDGLTWRKESSRAGFPSRLFATVYSFGGKAWINGGWTADESKNDIWSTTDGLDWTLETASAAYSKRSGHAVVEHGGKLFVLGGTDDTGTLSDVWSSADGVSWTEETAANFPARSYHSAFVLDDKIWVVGGYDETHVSQDDVWMSENGVEWNRVVESADFGAFAYQPVAVWNDKAYLIRGTAVWTSDNGTDWTSTVPTDAWGNRNLPNLVVAGDELWLIGGYSLVSPYGPLNDVWATSDGINWQQRTASAAYSPRLATGAVHHDGRTLLVGGSSDFDQAFDDVWSSTDGEDWRIGHRTVISF